MNLKDKPLGRAVQGLYNAARVGHAMYRYEAIRLLSVSYAFLRSTIPTTSFMMRFSSKSFGV